MALDKRQFPILGEDIKEFQIVKGGGPNDWDLWLCLRKTIQEVTFHVDKSFYVPTAGDAKKWLEVQIISMRFFGRCKDFNEFDNAWDLEGWTRNCRYSVPFRALYDSNLRKGKAQVGAQLIMD